MKLAQAPVPLADDRKQNQEGLWLVDDMFKWLMLASDWWRGVTWLDVNNNTDKTCSHKQSWAPWLIIKSDTRNQSLFICQLTTSEYLTNVKVEHVKNEFISGVEMIFLMKEWYDAGRASLDQWLVVWVENRTDTTDTTAISRTDLSSSATLEIDQ